MPWVKLDDSWYDSPKFIGLEPASIGVWVMCLTYCARHLTDGYFSHQTLLHICPLYEPASIEDLVSRGLLDETNDGWFIHDYLDFQPSAAKVRAERETRQAAGAAGGRASSEARQRSNSGTPVPSRPVPSRPETHSADDEFDKFWALYPRKVGKAAARKAWARAVKAATPAEIRWALEQQRPALLAMGERYRPHPSTWLNGERWLDEPAEPQAAQRSDREVRNDAALASVIDSIGASVTAAVRELSA
jgi:hypothetical protein